MNYKGNNDENIGTAVHVINLDILQHLYQRSVQNCLVLNPQYSLIQGAANLM